MKKYEIFLFDADNTLYDYDKAEEYALKNMFEYCGFAYTPSIRTTYRKFNDEMWEAYEKKEISIEDFPHIRFDYLFESIGVKYDSKDFNAKYLKELGKGSFLIDGAEELCKKIVTSKKLIYIVTNGLLATQESRIKYSLIKDYISGSFVSSEVGYLKPEVGFFKHVFSNIPQISKDKILIIGDSLTADIAGGINAGIDTCWFNLHGIDNHTGIKPTYEVSSLSEVCKFI